MVKIPYYILSFYALGLMVYVIASWANDPRAIRLCQFLEQFYLPFLTPLRQKIRPINMGGLMLDIAPIVLFVAIVVVQNLILMLFRGI